MGEINKVFYKVIFSIIILIITGGLTVFSADEEGKFISAGGNLFPVYTIQKAGNDNDNFVILFLGDGYTKDEQEKFLDDITSRSGDLLKKEPFKSYSHKINVYAIPTISEESGTTDLYGESKNTYFSVAHRDTTTGFTGNGESKAREIRRMFEKTYLDYGGVVGTIHILSNSTTRFGTSTGSLFSFSSVSNEHLHGEALIHEVAHSVGKLKDENWKIREGPNTSKTNEPESVSWKKLLGFRGTGITTNGIDPNGFVPSLSCIMRSEFDDGFCEVCKEELVKRLNSHLYMDGPEKYYVADPDITICHTGNLLGEDYEKYRVHNGNLKKANGKSLELRTVVQNLTKQKRRFKLILKIVDMFGNNKFFKEEYFDVEPLPDYATSDFEYEPARKSISVVIENISGIEHTDKVYGQVIDCETNEVVKDDKADKTEKYVVNIHHKLNSADGSISDLPNTYATKIYLPPGTVYYPKALKQLNGYVYTGNSLENNGVVLTKQSTDINYYYRKAKPNIEAVISGDKKAFTVRPYDFLCGNIIVAALYNDQKLCDIKCFTYKGEDVKFVTDKKYTSVKIFGFLSVDDLRPVCDFKMY